MVLRARSCALVAGWCEANNASNSRKSSSSISQSLSVGLLHTQKPFETLLRRESSQVRPVGFSSSGMCCVNDDASLHTT